MTSHPNTETSLMAAQPDVTIVTLTGFGLHFIREACALARLVAPALVVVEDVDLIAESRGIRPGLDNPLLFQLLNEMDGVAGDCDIAFVLTTNRADLIEPALAQRPGRVDLAVEVPLPDAVARRHLLALYGPRLVLAPDEVDAIVAETEGATASFFAELSRRAELLAATGVADSPAGLAVVRAVLAELRASRDALARATVAGSGPLAGPGSPSVPFPFPPGPASVAMVPAAGPPSAPGPGRPSPPASPLASQPAAGSTGDRDGPGE
jgi:cell division protease FtsH